MVTVSDYDHWIFQLVCQKPVSILRWLKVWFWEWTRVKSIHQHTTREGIPSARSDLVVGVVAGQIFFGFTKKSFDQGIFVFSVIGAHTFVIGIDVISLRFVFFSIRSWLEVFFHLVIWLADVSLGEYWQGRCFLQLPSFGRPFPVDPCRRLLFQFFLKKTYRRVACSSRVHERADQTFQPYLFSPKQHNLFILGFGSWSIFVTWPRPKLAHHRPDGCPARLCPLLPPIPSRHTNSPYCRRHYIHQSCSGIDKSLLPL